MEKQRLSTWRVFALLDKLLITHAMGAFAGAPIAMIFGPKMITHVILAGWIIACISVVLVAVIRLFDLDKEPKRPKKMDRYKLTRKHRL